MRLLKYFSILVVFLIIAISFRHYNSPYQIIKGNIFGTYYNIKIKTDKKNKYISDLINLKLQEVNSAMSIFDKNSEISKINTQNSKEWTSLSPQMSFLLKNAYDVYQKSHGKFDPTIGPLVNLWGFGVDGLSKYPSDEKISQALQNVGFDKLEFSPNFAKLRKMNPQTYLNLSAIAKGYGVDEVAELLQKEGYQNFVVEIGGEVRVSGQKENNQPWSIGVAKPSDSTNENAFTISLEDYSLATSGDYRNFFSHQGKRFSHTISPQNGRPVEHNLASVTIFDKSCMMADAYATAIMAMGEVEGLKFANNHQIPAIFFVRSQENQITNIFSQSAQNLFGE